MASRNPNYQQIHFNFIHKTYLTPKKAYRMRLAASPNCTLCSLNATGTFIHMMWECPTVKTFWEQIVKYLSKVLQKQIPCCPKLLLLNDDISLNLNIVQRRFWLAGSTAAKKMLALRWQAPHSLPFNHWKQLLCDVVIMELSTARLNGANCQTIDSWNHILYQVRTSNI